MSEELTPMNHRELWLQAIATGTVPEWLEPMTHEELWLKAIAQGGGGGSQLPVEIVTYTKNYNGTYECDHTYEDILELRNSGVPYIGVYKFMASSSGSSADTMSVAPITKEYNGVAYVFVTFFERKDVSATKTTTYVDRIEHKSDGSITNAWTKKYTITFDT